MLLLLILVLLPIASCNKTIEYLTHYGYISDASLTQDVGPAVKLFQEAFGLEPTGILDEPTLELMARPRCGNKDSLSAFSASTNVKFNFTNITYSSYLPTQYDHIIRKAFDVWEKHSNLIFKKVFRNPTIYISLSGQRNHVLFSRHDMCYYDFDGPGGVLAHAYYPTTQYNGTDIHFDSEERWDFSMDLPRYGNVSFFLTLVHEIGHALGLGHSYDNQSIMFPHNRDPVGIASLNEYELSADDKLAIQFLYGVKSTTTTTSSTTTTSTTTTTTTTAPTPLVLHGDKNICDYRNKINTFVIVNGKIFAFYNRYVWILNLDPARRLPEEYTQSRVITNWLRFLPRNFTKVSGVYQRPNGIIALYTDTEAYLFKYPSMVLSNRYRIDSILGRSVSSVNTVISTNQGKTFVIVDDYSLYEIDECMYTGVFLGATSTTLNGVPGKVNGAFRYINGRLYFITPSSVLEYDEFRNTVTGSTSDAFDVLGITCVRETLINRLYELLKHLNG